MATIVAQSNESLGSQVFQTPSQYTDGTVFTLTGVGIYQLTADGKLVTTKVGADDVAKGFIAFTTSITTEPIYLSSVLKARMGFDENGKLTAFHPQGDFVTAVQSCIAGLPAGTTLAGVKNALQALVPQFTQLQCTWREFAARGKDGRDYSSHVRDFNKA